jgi:hypothetical protein
MKLINALMKESTIMLEFFELFYLNILIYSIVKRIIILIPGHRRKRKKMKDEELEIK